MGSRPRFPSGGLRGAHPHHLEHHWPFPHPQVWGPRERVGQLIRPRSTKGQTGSERLPTCLRSHGLIPSRSRMATSFLLTNFKADAFTRCAILYRHRAPSRAPQPVPQPFRHQNSSSLDQPPFGRPSGMEQRFPQTSVPGLWVVTGASRGKQKEMNSVLPNGTGSRSPWASHLPAPPIGASRVLRSGLPTPGPSPTPPPQRHQGTPCS